jgi:hypothetical protein
MLLLLLLEWPWGNISVCISQALTYRRHHARKAHVHLRRIDKELQLVWFPLTGEIFSVFLVLVEYFLVVSVISFAVMKDHSACLTQTHRGFYIAVAWR